jgi:peptidoglycan/LPS O-acetylase OafA/YrhL
MTMLIMGLAVEQFGHVLPVRADSLLNKVFVFRGAQIVLAFLMGIITYQIRYHIPYSKWVAAGCALVCLVAVFLLGDASIDHVGNRFIVLPAIVYITVFLGLTPIPIPKILHTGDYSYGIYLYHDPLLHVIIGVIPAVVLIQGWGALALAALGLPAVALLAAFSWHVVEKPVLGLRKRFSFVARVRGVASGADLSVAPALPPGSVATRDPSFADDLRAKAAF